MLLQSQQATFLIFQCIAPLFPSLSSFTAVLFSHINLSNHRHIHIEYRWFSPINDNLVHCFCSIWQNLFISRYRITLVNIDFGNCGDQIFLGFLENCPACCAYTFLLQFTSFLQVTLPSFLQVVCMHIHLCKVDPCLVQN